jgi:ubiquinone biosynthesis monooxygenase Coq7
MTADAAYRAKPIPPRPGPGAVKRRLGEILRVDHAGELAAVHIYRGQRAVLGGAPGKTRITGELEEMAGQEAAHLEAFDALLNENQVRPSLFAPVWRAAGFALGAATALMGEKAAHACTEAVEDVIEKHYAGQIEELQDRDPALAAKLSAFRDDELAHQVKAVEQGAREAAAYPVLSAVIRAGCRAAIKVAEKI